jgi:hypothetical protein
MSLVTHACGICGRVFDTDARAFQLHMKAAHGLDVMAGDFKITTDDAQPAAAQAGQGPQRLTPEREVQIRERYALSLNGDVMAIRDLLDELDATRNDLQQARAESVRLRKALAPFVNAATGSRDGGVTWTLYATNSALLFAQHALAATSEPAGEVEACWGCDCDGAPTATHECNAGDPVCRHNEPADRQADASSQSS